MPVYTITSKTSGADPGTYHAADEQHALDAMARDAGYADFADACGRSGDDGYHLVVTKLDHVEVVVPADEDEDDCLAAAAEAHIADHPALRGYDLEPRWTDDERDTVTLSVPAWAAPVDLAKITARVTARGDQTTVPGVPGAVDADIELNGIHLGAVTLLPGEGRYSHVLSTWSRFADHWADAKMQQFLDDREGCGQSRSEVIDAIVGAVREAAK